MPSSKSKTWYVSKLVSKSFSVCSPIYSDAQGSKPIKCASVYGYGRPWRESRKRRPRDIGPARCIFNTLSSQSSGLGAEPDPHPQHCVLPNMASLATSSSAVPSEKGPNFNPEEDILLAKAWISASEQTTYLNSEQF